MTAHISTRPEFPSVALSDIIFDVQPGFASGKNETNGVMQVRMNNVGTDGSLNWDKIRRVPASDMQLRNYALKFGDVLFNATNSPSLVGKSAFFAGHDEPVVYSNHFMRLRPDQKRLHPQYLSWWLTYLWERHVFEGLCIQWVNQATVRREDLLALRIPLPALSEQQHIASILDKADAIRRKRAESLRLADNLLKSAFLDLFGDLGKNAKRWTQVKLDDLVVGGDRINYGVVQPGSDVENGISIVRVGDFREGLIDKNNLKRIAPSIEAQYSRSRLHGDEVLISCVGSIGEIALADSDLKGCNIVRAVARVPLQTDIEREYIAAYLRTPIIQAYFQSETRTVSQPTLNIVQIRETPIVVPPKELRVRFKAIYQGLMNTKVNLTLHSSKCEDLFASLTQRAFRGEL